MQELRFPILLYTPYYLMGSIASKSQLHVVSERKLDAGCFDNGVIIDASGARYRIIAAHKKSTRRLTYLHILKAIVGWDRWGSKPIWAELELHFSGKLNLDEIKKEIMDLLLKNKDWFAKYGETEQGLRKAVFEPRSVQELINSISIYP